MRKSFGALFTAAVLLAITGCATTDTATVSETGPAGTNRPAETAEPAAEEPAAEERAQPETATFGETYTWEDGVAVTISAPNPFTPSEYAAGTDGGDQYVRFTVTIVNGSTETYEDWFSTTMQSGNTEASEIFDGEAGLNGPPMTPILAGREAVFDIGYAVTNPADLVMQVSPGFTYDNAIFTN